MVTEPPLVSIVIATFNRSAALRCALSSVSKQTVTEWETIVVGDCCTDDTADVVGSFDDPRIGFINLPVNFGEQSGPNNVGIERSRARLIAFLNHDDLWLPNHLEHSLVALHARCADLVFGPNLNIVPGAVAGEPPIVIVDGLSRAGRYDPRQIDRATVAST